jgi:mannose-6-phosphate isomerase
LYDWGRVDATGNPRPLHVDKAMQAIHFGSRHGGAAHPLAYAIAGGQCTVLAACRYFAAELLTFEHGLTRGLNGDSFHMLLAKDGPVSITTCGAACTLTAGEAVVVPAMMQSFTVTGPGAVLDFYVPGLVRDIVEPLRTAGHPAAAIGLLGGPPETSDVPSEPE